MNERNGKRVFTGYDGSTYSTGDRVELHPGCDYWIRGARYATVVGSSLTPEDRVHVDLDVRPVSKGYNKFCGPEDRFRAVK